MMMGHGYDGGGAWMWVFGGLMMLGVLVLIGLVVWAVIAATNRGGSVAATSPVTWADAPGHGRCWTSGMRAVRSTPRSTPSVCTRWGCDMRPLSRRRALQLGGLGVAGIVVGSAGLAWAGTTRYEPVAGETFTAPTVLTNDTGNLTLTLEAAAGRGTLAGRDATTLRYNGSVPGPTLHLRPGDHLGIDLINHLDQPTNLHTHGLQVSPQGNSDNPFVMVNPGQTFHYDYQIPDDHPTGTFWYHPHHHGLAADQVYGGLYGAIVIGEPDPPQVSADRVLVISDITLDGAGVVPPATAMQRMTGREGELVLVNGQSRPQLTAQPGARERWRIVNACVARYLRLRLDGQDLQLLGIDLPLGGEAPRVEEVLLAPGNRADLLVTTRAGTSTLQTLPYNRGTAWTWEWEWDARLGL